MNAIPKLSPRPCSTLDVPELGLQPVDPVVPRPRGNVPLYLLLESLLEQLCLFYESDDGIRKELFLALRHRLSQLELLDRIPDLQELSSIRLRFRQAFGALVGDVKRNLRSLVSPKPRHSIALHGSDEVDGRQGRYVYDFEEIEEIAQGGFGIVCKAKKRMDGYVYAIKKIPFKYYNHKLLKQILREVELLAQLSHPHVVAYKTAWIENIPVVTVTEGRSTVDSLQSLQLCLPSFSKSCIFSCSTMPLSPSCTNGNTTKHSAGIPRPLLQRSTSVFTEKDYSNCDDNGYLGGQCASLQEPPDADDIVFASGDSLSLRTEFHVRVRLNSKSDSEVRKSTIHTFEYSERKTSSDESRSPHSVVTAREHAFQLLNALASVLFIQMELCSGNLADWLASRNLRLQKEAASGNCSVNTEEVLAIFKQILKGVQYIHSQGLIHRDLKPQNILFDSRGSRVKLGDFGLATMNCEDSGQELSSHQWGQSLGHTQGVGTSLYAAPEQRQQAFYDDKVDIYSLGVVLTELTCPFFTAHERISELQKLRQGCLPDSLQKHSPSVVSTVQAMCHQNPKERPSAAEILHSPLFIAKDEVSLRILVDCI
ncbi:unnamed protein product [Ixodes hexagonus]